MGTAVVTNVVVGTVVVGAVLVVGAVVVDVVDAMEAGGRDDSDVDSSEAQATLTMHAPSTTAAPQRRSV